MNRREWSRPAKLAGSLGAMLLMGFQTMPLLAQAHGEELFLATCAACHSLGADRLIGPGLGGVAERRDRDWLLSFITEPDRMLASDDSIAIRLRAEYPVSMPNLGITRDQAAAIVDYLASAEGASRADQAVAADASLAVPDEERVRLGMSLFQGSTRFSNGGPGCNACHGVTHGSVLGGGSLAADLTDSFSRLGPAGVRAIMTTPPFPVMQRAFAGHPLTEEEVVSLVAFLQRADMDRGAQSPPRHGLRLLGTGLGGSILVLGLYSAAWRGRRRGSVSQSIYDRQLKSS